MSVAIPAMPDGFRPEAVLPEYMVEVGHGLLGHRPRLFEVSLIQREEDRRLTLRTLPGVIGTVALNSLEEDILSGAFATMTYSAKLHERIIRYPDIYAVPLADAVLKDVPLSILGFRASLYALRSQQFRAVHMGLRTQISAHHQEYSLRHFVTYRGRPVVQQIDTQDPEPGESILRTVVEGEEARNAWKTIRAEMARIGKLNPRGGAGGVRRRRSSPGKR